jgi:hypothetical protein
VIEELKNSTALTPAPDESKAVVLADAPSAGSMPVDLDGLSPEVQAELAEHATAIRANNKAMRKHRRAFLKLAYDNGGHFIAARKRHPGKWLDWVEKETETTDQTARNQMNFARLIDRLLESKTVLDLDALLDLSIDVSVWYRLGAPSTSEAAVNKR